MTANFQKLGRFGLRALRIVASTAAIVELLRADWSGGISAALAWVVFVTVERRWPLPVPLPVPPPVEEPEG
ncbi:hypothetical protein KQ302_07145 [Synechococcus sp. CS-602]|uniref:hypothetical protein n=1 Tax=Synechococcaceae TaxID=1890426 RepID=UPI0008FF1758|nr:MULTISPECIES: hypothetical protein [Synechococcaceae]MCT4364014.1 hypothetical protein [Candidatus Regnicoccus frigidus MAG-AL1]APD49155.1 hypothetical protein BM449_00765 [Synechococcus sp. SynAce01]MCT0204877.1 hypothetical protein [Synechococcus sp. CS-602]MCT0245834.1 hypothetical protein [Synechococcus sp. CS-601]MCT4368737.1 hypothetical protein [Candidatus Regnicoccus frigidus MAG-AL2]